MALKQPNRWLDKPRASNILCQINLNFQGNPPFLINSKSISHTAFSILLSGKPPLPLLGRSLYRTKAIDDMSSAAYEMLYYQTPESSKVA